VVKTHAVYDKNEIIGYRFHVLAKNVNFVDETIPIYRDWPFKVGFRVVKDQICSGERKLK